MGWFWADPTPPPAAASLGEPWSSPPPRRRRPGSSCPIHQKSGGGGGGPLFDPAGRRSPPTCPITHGSAERRSSRQADEASILSHLNPLNHMPRDLSQGRAPGQTHALPTTRDLSTIPRGAPSSGSGPGEGGNWEYPSPQQMYNALLRKGYADTDPTAVESMVAVHNFLNEGAWAEIVGWEERFRGGLLKGWRICERGEENAGRIERRMRDGTEAEPRLVRFLGRPGEMTPRAAMLQMLGKFYPARFGTEPPFDRHDWYVSRTMDGQTREVRYVIDYYSGPPEPTGEPVFYLDVRPAATLTGAAERFIRWGGDVWWRAAGGEARDRPWLNWGGAETK